MGFELTRNLQILVAATSFLEKNWHLYKRDQQGMAWFPYV